MTRITHLCAILAISIITASCDRPACENTNPIFDKYSPGENEYKDELLNQLSQIEKSKLTYRVETYQKIHNSEYIGVHIQGDGLCAKIILLIKNSHKGIENILEHEGMGYMGAELKELKFSISQDSAKTEFVFQEVSNIVD
jgi:hypothetical protein